MASMAGLVRSHRDSDPEINKHTAGCSCSRRAQAPATPAKLDPALPTSPHWESCLLTTSAGCSTNIFRCGLGADVYDLHPIIH